MLKIWGLKLTHCDKARKKQQGSWAAFIFFPFSSFHNVQANLPNNLQSSHIFFVAWTFFFVLTWNITLLSWISRSETNNILCSLVKRKTWGQLNENFLKILNLVNHVKFPIYRNYFSQSLCYQWSSKVAQFCVDSRPKKRINGF